MEAEEIMAKEHEEHRAFQENVAREHEERLTGYRALLARIESAAADVQMAADDATTNTTSQFTDDLRYVIGLSEEILKRFRHHDASENADKKVDTSS
jgi:type II secretory pathway component PulM